MKSDTIEQPIINGESHGSIYIEMEGIIAAIHDQLIATKVYKKNILGEPLKQHQKPEYLHHLIAGCSILAPQSYLERHNRVGNIFTRNLAKSTWV